MNITSRFLATAVILTSLTVPHATVVAQAEAPQRPQPCTQRPEFDQFDFWIGHWEVRDGKGNVAGTNRITKRANGCVLVEEWISAGGGSGVSINYYDPVAEEWVQVWSGSGGTQITMRGGLDAEGAMRLDGDLHYVGRGQTVRFRGAWTPLEDGRVRQYFEQSTDDGETWEPWFEGFYSRLPEAR